MAKKEKAVKEKSLEKMTATELRTVATELQGIAGVHGMNKAELVAAIKKAKGIEDAPSKKSRSEIVVRDIKTKIKELKKKKKTYTDEKNRKKADIFRRRISRLKKKTRKSI